MPKQVLLTLRDMRSANILRDWLESIQACRVTVAADGAACCLMLRHGHWDVVLTDSHLLSERRSGIRKATLKQAILPRLVAMTSEENFFRDALMLEGIVDEVLITPTTRSSLLRALALDLDRDEWLSNSQTEERAPCSGIQLRRSAERQSQGSLSFPDEPEPWEREEKACTA